jgi:hypothetical protein
VSGVFAFAPPRSECVEHRHEWEGTSAALPRRGQQQGEHPEERVVHRNEQAVHPDALAPSSAERVGQRADCVMTE